MTNVSAVHDGGNVETKYYFIAISIQTNLSGVRKNLSKIQTHGNIFYFEEIVKSQVE